MTANAGDMGQVTVDADEERQLARVLYLRYCEVKGFRPTREPYVPAWALDYARTALDWVDGDIDQ